MLLLWVVACASYAPGDAAQEALESSDTVQVTTAKWLSFEPSEPIGSVGLMFYPGGLVQPEAYAPPIRRFAEAGIPSYISFRCQPTLQSSVLDEVNGCSRPIQRFPPGCSLGIRSAPWRPRASPKTTQIWSPASPCGPVIQQGASI